MDMWTKAQQLEPGIMIYYTLDSLKRPTQHIDADAWGVCEYAGSFWIGKEVSVGGKNVLRIPFQDILDKRDEQYVDWGDEETYLLFGLDEETGEFKWFLLNKEEFDSNEKHYKSVS